MTADDIQVFLRTKPFETFDLVMIDGNRYPIPHPEMAVLARTMVAVGVYDDPTKTSNGDGIADHTIHCSIFHIARVEPSHARAT